MSNIVKGFSRTPLGKIIAHFGGGKSEIINKLASSSEEGLVSILAQQFAGDKSFLGNIYGFKGVNRASGANVIAPAASITAMTSDEAGAMYLCLAGCYSGAGSGNFFSAHAFLEHPSSGLRSFAIASASYSWSASGRDIVLTNGAANSHTIHWAILRMK